VALGEHDNPSEGAASRLWLGQVIASLDADETVWPGHARVDR
jgi:hypothetical protein